MVKWGIIFAGSPKVRKITNLKPVSSSVLSLIGNTPLLEFSRLDKGLKGRVYAKAEFQNPSGSIKDRMVSYALKAAEKRGEIIPGDTIVEASSGNTGVSISMVAAVKNYKAIIVVPDSTSQIKINMMKEYGAQILYTPANNGVNAAVQKAKEIADEHNIFLLNQFGNPDNIRAHNVTGREILFQARQVDVFVAGVGTGSTLIGVAEVLKKESPETKIIAVEPYTAPAFFNMFYREKLPIDSGIPHKIEGIGESFVPDILRKKHYLVDDVILVTDRDAFNTRSRLALKEGLFVGISSGANVDVALKLAKNALKGETIVTILPDNGLRYF